MLVDSEKLNQIMNVLVNKTSSFTAEKLIALQTKLMMCVFEHKDDFDKTILLQKLENMLKNECK